MACDVILLGGILLRAGGGPRTYPEEHQTNTILTLTAAAINVGLNYVLIPWFGIAGAAISTLAAYLPLSAMLFLLSQWINPVSYQYRRIGILTTAMVTVLALGAWFPTFDVAFDLIARLGLFLSFFFVLLTAVGFWQKEEEAIVRDRLYRGLALLR